MAIALEMILPGVVIGVIAGIVDMIFMIKDESGSANIVLSHGLGAFIPLIIAGILSFNLSWLMAMDFAQGNILSNEIAMRIFLILIVAIITFSKSRIFKGARGIGTHESLIHTLIVAGIVAAAPYLWLIIGPFLPLWMSGSSG